MTVLKCMHMHEHKINAEAEVSRVIITGINKKDERTIEKIEYLERQVRYGTTPISSLAENVKHLVLENGRFGVNLHVTIIFSVICFHETCQVV